MEPLGKAKKTRRKSNVKNLGIWMFIQALLGIWLFFSPYALGGRTMTANDMILGAVVAILGFVVAFRSIPDLGHRERKIN